MYTTTIERWDPLHSFCRLRMGNRACYCPADEGSILSRFVSTVVMRFFATLGMTGWGLIASRHSRAGGNLSIKKY